MSTTPTLQISYRGSTCALGNAGDSYCILHTDKHGRTAVMRTFPLSDQGWQDAWTTFVRQEPHHVALSQSETKNLIPPPPTAHPAPENLLRHRAINTSVLRGAFLTGASAAFIATLATLFSVTSLGAGYTAQTQPVLLLVAFACLVGGIAFGSLAVALPHTTARARLSLLLGGLAIGLFGTLFTVFASMSTPVATGTFLNSLTGVLAGGSLFMGSLTGTAAVLVWPHDNSSRKEETAHLFLLLSLLGVLASSLFLGYAALAQDPVIAPFTATFVDILVAGTCIAVAVSMFLFAAAWHNPSAKTVGVGTGAAFVAWAAAAILAAFGITYPGTAISLITVSLGCVGTAILTITLFWSSPWKVQETQAQAS